MAAPALRVRDRAQSLISGAVIPLPPLTELERAIGVIYRPESERQGHYFEAVLAEQFDAFVWFAETSPLAPLARPRKAGVPENLSIWRMSHGPSDLRRAHHDRPARA
jgi:hypothetical protein